MLLILKTLALGLFYGFLLWAFLTFISKTFKIDSLKKQLSSPRSILMYFFFASLSLFVYSKTDRGNHGNKDHQLLPIGNGLKIEHIPNQEIFIDSKNLTIFGLGPFAYNKDYLFSKLIRTDKNDQTGYIILDKKSKEFQYHISKERYLRRARPNQYPFPEEFKTFEEHYKDYWKGWRYWLLP